jgi:signal transduction histidine kinase
MSSLEQVHRRLEDLYEISKLFANFENVEQTFVPALDIATRTLPLRSAILMEAEGGSSKMNIWPSEGQDSEQMRAVKAHVEAAFAYLVGPASTNSLAGTEGNLVKRFIVLPLVVAHRPPFGALQLEGAQPLDKTDLIFVNAIANQLAIALDRDRTWRRDITRREHAEEGQTHAEEGRTHAEERRTYAEEGRTHAEERRTHAEEGRTEAEEGRTEAEARGATSERERILAENSSDKYEALAGENARLYEQAQQAVRVREQILAVVSHDLKNPLGAILLTTDALAKKGALPEAVGRIQRAAKRMLRLIDDLLDFASIEAGHLAIKRQPQDMGTMFQETLATFEGVAQDKGLQLTAAVEPDLPKVYCDRDRILQVLSNLVGNATKATPAGGQITLRGEAREHELLFAVSDNGPGISEEDVKHLFERYWRSDEVEYKGTGLGLAIARGIVSAHGGRIWVESELGHGATFLFTIPAADATFLFTVPAPDAASSAQGLNDARLEKGA